MKIGVGRKRAGEKKGAEREESIVPEITKNMIHQMKTGRVRKEEESERKENAVIPIGHTRKRWAMMKGRIRKRKEKKAVNYWDRRFSV
mmetsp:Transcript_16092/g.19057  ORF Transcript_16092/g.19057 Transcript_16092/m.19057 type:complete len:88 (-) Transcript_16092:95-358(-)